jgi:photosystem II stability/assembly factor-like uncharacterized protein
MDGGLSWSSVGEEMSNAKIYRLRMDPTNPQIIYAAVYRAGVYKSVDGGNVWNSSGLLPDFIYDVAVNPSSNSTIYAGTAGDGLYKSGDSGGSWSRSDTGLKATSVTSLAFDPDTLAEIYASVYGGGVYKTPDRGVTWEEVNSGLDDKWVHVLVMAPDDPLTLYAGTDGSGVYKSNDGGDNWSSANAGFPTFSPRLSGLSPPFNHLPERGFVDEGLLLEFDQNSEIYPAFNFGGTNLSVQVITIDEDSPTSVYAGTGGAGVFKSTNGGSSWTPTGLTAVSVNAIEIDPSNPANIFAGVGGTDGSLLKSFNSGTDWLFMNVGLNDQTVYSIAFDPGTPGKMFAGTGDGVYLSSNGGNSWSPSALTGVATYSLAVNTVNQNYAYAGTADGFFISSDGGSTWNLDNSGLVNTIVQTIELDFTNSGIYIGSKGSGLYRRRGMLP